ncbi:MAG: hypothetical protein KIT70_10620 [Anaerolineales bacterium]|nr:MAG: hypothetical protein KIT70_10620 [Anaerolineales bacterium]
MRKCKNNSPKVIVILFAALAVLLAACSTPAAPPAATLTATAAPATSTPQPTATNASTLTPTEVVELVAPDQVWMEDEVFAVARTAGFEPVYELTYFPETVHIPWTVDADGNTVQGITSLDMCGDGSHANTEPPYLLFFKLLDGLPQKSIDLEIENFGATVWHGPNYALRTWANVPIPEQALGFIVTETVLEARETWFSIRKELGYDIPDFYPHLILPICEGLYEVYNSTFYKDTTWFMPGFNK